MRHRISPFRELAELERRIAHIFEQVRAERARLAAPWRVTPALDVAAKEDEYIVWIDLPAVAPEDVKVFIDDELLVVRGVKREGVSEGKKLRREREYGEFVRAVALPSDVVLEQAEAKLSQGVLRIRLARRHIGTRRQIPIVEEKS